MVTTRNDETPALKKLLSQLQQKLADAQSQLLEAHTTLDAIQSGEVDVVVVRRPQRAPEMVALERSADPYQIFVENMAEGAFMTDPDGVVVFCNRRLADMLHLAPDAILGKEAVDFVLPSEHARARRLFGAGRRGPVQEEITMSSPNRRFSTLLSVAPVETARFQGLCGLATDLSDQRRAEAALQRALERAQLVDALEQALALRNEFITVASHELKTPITSLFLQLQMLQKRTGGSGVLQQDVGQLRRSIATSLQQAKRLGVLVDDLLDVSQLQWGRLKLHRESVDLSALSGDIVARYRDVWGDITLEQEIEPAVVGTWDPVRLEQVVVNLLGNAVKHAPGSRMTLSVRRHAGTAVLTVHDTGPGIPVELQARIFGRFERFASVRHVGGFGIGLYIARQIAEAHGGTIRVDSARGAGTSFIVELPIGHVESATIALR